MVTFLIAVRLYARRGGALRGRNGPAEEGGGGRAIASEDREDTPPAKVQQGLFS